MATLRMMFIFVCLFNLFCLTASCGGSTHIEISYRAADQFQPFQSNVDYDSLLKKHPDALEAGTPYPDSYYPNLCARGKYHDIAEDTHWTPFLNATVNYIRKHYPPPWDMATEKLVVFLLGIVSHQVADISWHGLGIEQGFLDTMGAINYHGSFDDAHTAGDPGGDVLVHFELLMDYMPYLSEWYVPVDDLYAIYIDLYGTERMPVDIIIECTSLMYAERLGEKLAIAKMYPKYSRQSPFLLDQLTDYFLGGIDDMAVWTQTIWRDTVHMLENGTEVCKLDHNPLFIQCKWGPKPFPKSSKKPEKNGFYAKRRYMDIGQKDIVVEKTLRGVKMSPSPWMQEALQRTQKQREIKTMMKKEQHRKSLISANHKLPDAVYSVKNTYAKLGWSMTAGDLDGDGNEDIVIGAPGYRVGNTTQSGAVFILFSTDSGLPLGYHDLKQSADVILQGPDYLNDRLGSSVAILDINQDGHLDIAVGSPSTGSSLLSYIGAVIVYYGIGHRYFVHNMTIICSDHYCNLGQSLATADINNDGYADLLVGSPFSGHNGDQRGVVAALLSDKQYIGYFAMLLLDQLYWVVSGSQNYSWFGENMYSYRIDNGTSLVFITEPKLRKCAYSDCSFSANDTQSIGQLNIYKTMKGSQPSLIQQIKGINEFQNFGSSVAVGRPYPDGAEVIAIGATGQDVEGSFEGLFPLNFPQTGTVSLFDLSGSFQKPLAVFSGDRRFSRFGRKIMFTDLNGDGFDDFIIGAPLRTEDFTEEIHPGEEGALYVFYGGKTFPRGDHSTFNCSDSSLIIPCPAQSASLELVFGEDLARFGAEIVVVKSKTKIDLVVTAIHSSSGARLSGAVAVYSFPLTRLEKAHSGRKH